VIKLVTEIICSYYNSQLRFYGGNNYRPSKVNYQDSLDGPQSMEDQETWMGR